jgi:N utilization substance protein A
VKNDFMMAINQVCHERQLPLDIVLEAVEVALISAYKRNFSGNHVTAQIDPKSGEPLIFVEKAVVNEVQDEKNEISLEAALKVTKRATVGGLVSIESTPANFGRIAAQTAKQVILQRIREAERDALYNTYAEREGEIVNGTVHKIDPHQVTLSLGKVEAYLPRSEQIPTERYGEGQRLRAYVSSVSKASRGPQIVVSRTHRNMLRRLLEVEVPEIYNGTVEIKSIAREAGYRSKVAVAALQEGVDPVGSCVGMRGTRIQNIVNELNGEKIDVVQWNPDLSFFIANSLSPARVMNVRLHDEQGKTAEVVVPDKQLSLAIGKEGQNARLAAKLTAWRIDIKSASEAAQEALEKSQKIEAIRERLSERTSLFESVKMILASREPVEYSESELNTLSEAIEAVNLAEMAIARERRAKEEAKAQAAREAARARDILAEAEIILSRSTTPDIEVEADAELIEAEAQAESEPALMDEAPSEAIPELAEPVEPVVETIPAVAEMAEDVPPVVAETAPAMAVETAPPAETEAEEKPDSLVAEAEAILAVKQPGDKVATGWETQGSEGSEWDDDVDDATRKRGKKAARDKKRRLVYDERLGEVVTERRRKRSRRSDDWLDYEQDE